MLSIRMLYADCPLSALSLVQAPESRNSAPQCLYLRNPNLRARLQPAEMLFVILSLAFELLWPSAGKAQVGGGSAAGTVSGGVWSGGPEQARPYPLRDLRNAPIQNHAQAGHPFSGGDDLLRFAQRYSRKWKVQPSRITCNLLLQQRLRILTG